MLIEEVEIEGFGHFRERVLLGPFVPGLNVLAQRNEWGKSTVLKALTRALFDKYTCENAEIKALRPKGSSLAPRVRLIFTAAGERWQLRKRFLEGKGSELSRWRDGAWQRTDESDRADQRVRELLGAPRLEGRVVKPETWGLLRYLWARQDEPADWPSWDGAGGDDARRRLATVELDAHVGELLVRMEKRAAVFLTDSGRTKAKSPLETAAQQVAELTTELAALEFKRTETEALGQAHVRLRGEIAALENERVRLRAEAGALQAEASAAEKLQAALALLQAAQAQTEDKLQQVRGDATAHADLAQAVEEMREKIGRAQESAAQSSNALPALESAQADTQKTLAAARHAHATDELRLDRVRAALRLRAAMEEASTLCAQQERVQRAEGALTDLTNGRAALPTITAAQLKRWREFAHTIRDATVQLDAIGLSVTLLPDRAGVVHSGVEHHLAAGARETIKAPQTISLHLEDWGRIEISSGARGIGELEELRKHAERKLASELHEIGLATLADAEAASERTSELDRQLASARATFTALLGDHRDAAALTTAVTRAEAVVEQMRKLAEPAPSDDAPTLATLRSEEEELAARLRGAAKLADQLGEKVEAARERLDTARRAREIALSEQTTLNVRLLGLRERQALLAARYASDPAAALAAAQGEFTRAEARLAEARRQLPTNAEKLPARSVRAAKAAADAEAEYERKTRDLHEHEVLLRERGGEGLYSRIGAVEERLEMARAELAREREEAWASRLVAELIQQRQQSAIQTVLRPIEDRLSVALAELTGEHGRRVFFDEHLAVRGVGRSAAELVPFEDLSRGTREQLLLALRAAIALEVATSEPTCLILDDVLVHTDSMRQQNVLDYLQTLAQRVQVVILTCHAERYRGVGHSLAAAAGP